MSISGECFVWKPYVCEKKTQKQEAPSSKRTPTDLMQETSDLNTQWLACAQKSKTMPLYTISRNRGVTFESYDFAWVINKIKEFIRLGKKICLFIGRARTEKLPSDYESEADENEIWVGADIGHFPQIKKPEIDTLEDRLFLWMDLNDNAFLKLIKGLFDKVVIDLSTTKYLEKDFTMRFSSLLRNTQSEMIFTNPTKHGISTTQVEKEFKKDNYALRIDIEEFANKKESFYNTLDTVIEEERSQQAHDMAANSFHEEATSHMTAHLLTGYTSVKYITNEPFPYQSTCNPEKANIPHYVVKGKVKST
jgi:hypothetical protein